MLPLVACVSTKDFARVEEEVKTLREENKALRDAVVRMDERTNAIVRSLNGTANAGQQAQKQPEITPETVFRQADVMPSYPGGDKALFEFFGKNFKWPEGVEFKGQLETQFVVEPTGQISNFSFTKEGPKKIQEAIIEVFTKMPRWQPGSIKGNKVRVLYTLPITI